MDLFVRISEIWSTVNGEYEALRSIIGPVRLGKPELFMLFFRKAIYDVRLSYQTSSLGVRSVVLGLAILGGLLLLDNVTDRFSVVRRRGVPVLKQPEGARRWDYQGMLEEGRRKYPNSPYIIAHSGYDYVVYPSSCFDQVKRLPMSKASLLDFETHVFFQGWRFLGSDNSILHKMIAADLSRALPESTPARQKHTARGVQAVLGPCPEWKSILLYKTIQEVVARSSAATFMAPDLAENSWWLGAAQLFPMMTLLAVFVSHRTPRFARPVVAFIVFFPAWCIYWVMEMMLYPMVKRDISNFNATTRKGNAEKGTRPVSSGNLPITAWLMARYSPADRKARQIRRDFISLAFESIPATSATIYFILSELSCRPELVNELREEISQLLVDGQVPANSLGELKKMDSVMRESARINPFSYLGLYRRLSQPVKLSIGPELPAGTMICVDVHHINTSQALWESPLEFDPMRFLKLRQHPGQETRHQFTSLGADSPGFGDGPQACPGRFYASNSIKVFLCHFLINYEIQLDPKATKPKRNSMSNGSFSPDMFARIRVRARKLQL